VATKAKKAKKKSGSAPAKGFGSAYKYKTKSSTTGRVGTSDNAIFNVLGVCKTLLAGPSETTEGKRVRELEAEEKAAKDALKDAQKTKNATLERFAQDGLTKIQVSLSKARERQAEKSDLHALSPEQKGHLEKIEKSLTTALEAMRDLRKSDKRFHTPKARADLGVLDSIAADLKWDPMWGDEVLKD
jgi:primosomal protein N'